MLYANMIYKGISTMSCPQYGLIYIYLLKTFMNDSNQPLATPRGLYWNLTIMKDKIGKTLVRIKIFKLVSHNVFFLPFCC